VTVTREREYEITDSEEESEYDEEDNATSYKYPD